MYKAIDSGLKTIKALDIDECKTIEKVLRILGSYQLWEKIKKAASNYFTGKQIFKGLKNQSQINKNIIELSLYYYLNIYRLINFGWDVVEDEINGKFKLGCKNPGDLLRLILSLESIKYIKSPPRANPQTLYRAYLAISANPESENSKIYSRRLQKQTLYFSDDDMNLSDKIIYSCLDSIEKSSESIVAKSLVREFRESKQNILNFVLEEFRRNNFVLKLNYTK